MALLTALALLAMLAAPAAAQQATPNTGTPPGTIPGSAGTSYGIFGAPATGTTVGPTPSGEAENAAAKAPRTLGWFVAPQVSILETASTNGAYGVGPAKSDFITNLLASFVVDGATPRLTLHSDIGFVGIDYARSSQPGRVEPAGSLNGTLEAVEKHLFLDAGVTTVRMLKDPFQAAPTNSGTLNSQTATQEHVAPRLQGEIGSKGRYLLQSQNGWTQLVPSDPLTPNSYLGRQIADIQRIPDPIGAELNFEDDITRFGSPSNLYLYDQFSRAIPRVRPQEDLILGLRAGYERNNIAYVPSQRQGPIYGADLSWHPSAVNTVDGFVEHRNFGLAWDVSAGHRVPALSLELRSTRLVETAPQYLFSLGSGFDVRNLLNSIYAAQYPDLIQRNVVVNDVMSQLSNVGGTVGVFAENVSRVDDDQLVLLSTATRNIVTASLHYRRNELIEGETIPLPQLEVDTSSYSTIDTALGYTRRLTPTASASISAESNLFHGIGPTAGLYSKQYSLIGEFSKHFSTRMDGVIGIGRRLMDSNYGVGNSQESFAFAGVGVRL